MEFERQIMEKTIASYLAELIALRRDLHRHPELGFTEERTSGVIARNLTGYGVKVHTGWAKTGVVGVLSKGGSSRTIALRADMDALPIRETAQRPHGSANDGIMHACGHDGHMAMLLGAARYLAEKGKFDGSVVFIFQPAEEGGGGGRLMVEEGIVERFGIQSAYGLHNRSGMAAGTFSTRTGSIMAATDNFEITVIGEGTHAALPHTGVDPILTASHLVTALQSIGTRETEALDSIVISITQFNAGTAFNVIPDNAILKGCTRYQKPEAGVRIRESMERISANLCAAFGAGYHFNYMAGYPATVNSPRETRAAVRAASAAAVSSRVDASGPPLMGSEDFSYFLEKVPGCYMFLGNGADSHIHNHDYDFNDEIIPVGVRYWCTLVEQELGSSIPD